MKSNHWQAFYQQSLQLFQFLEQNTNKLFLEPERHSLDYQQDTYGIVSTAKNSGYLNKLSVAPKFIHAICQLNTEADLLEFQQQLEEYQLLYAIAANQELDEVKFPFIMPRLLDESVYQININSSKAFASKAYRPEDGNLVIKKWHYDLEDYASFEKAIDASDGALQELLKAGFNARIQEQEERRKLSLSLELNIQQLCQQQACDYIQYRKPTGIQYKVQLLQHNQDTIRSSLGVYVLRPQQQVSLYQSLPRKVRKDALYVDDHPDEIKLPIELEERYYRKHG